MSPSDPNLPAMVSEEPLPIEHSAASQGRGDLALIQTSQETIQKARTWTGYVLALLSIGIIGAIICWSAFSLPKLEMPAKDNPQALTYMLALIACHAVVAVAAILFAYQLLRAAERMLVPLWLVRDANLLIGKGTPARDLQRIAKALLEGTRGKE